MASDTARLLVPSRRKENYVAVTCPYTDCKASIEYLAPTPEAVAAVPISTTTFSVTCTSCGRNFDPPGAPDILRKIRGSAKDGKREGTGKRRIGTDERPLDMSYYDILQLPASATTEEIKKSYRKLAIKLHPDKNPNDPEGEERFKALAAAYQVLSDPALRHKYNEFGPKTPGLPSEDGVIDPEEVGVLTQIGTINMGRDMKEALQQDAEELEKQAEGESSEKDAALTAEQKAAKDAEDARKQQVKDAEREERVAALAEKLVRKLSIYTESVATATDEALADEVRNGFREITRLEAEELKTENYGVELLHAVGFVYAAKSRHYLASVGLFGSLGGMFHAASSSFHTVRETVSTVRAALELKGVFEELAKAEEQGITEERKKQLEDQAAEKGLRALFKGAKLEVEGVIREVADRVLYDTDVAKQTQRLRAEALGIIGEVYMQAKADPVEDEA